MWELCREDHFIALQCVDPFLSTEAYMKQTLESQRSCVLRLVSHLVIYKGRSTKSRQNGDLP